MITLGSAFYYEMSGGSLVANCHKMPANMFTKKMGTVEEVISVMDNMIHRLLFFNPNIKLILTVSPVRHLREGLVENNYSKATLIYAVHHLVRKFENLDYFPAYELVIDDLRDYRFYAEDMVHPNYLATAYVWEKFSESCLDPNLGSFMKEVDLIHNAMNHRAFNPESEAHLRFLNASLERVNQLQQLYPSLDFSWESNFFRQSLKP